MPSTDPWKQSLAAQTRAEHAYSDWRRARAREVRASQKATATFRKAEAARKRAAEFGTPTAVRKMNATRRQFLRAEQGMKDAAVGTDFRWKLYQQRTQQARKAEHSDNERLTRQRLIGTPKRKPRTVKRKRLIR